MPLNVRVAGIGVPLPALFGALVAALSWISVIALLPPEGHLRRRRLDDLRADRLLRLPAPGPRATSLTKRVSVPAEALAKKAPDVEYGTILVPVFG